VTTKKEKMSIEDNIDKLIIIEKSFLAKINDKKSIFYGFNQSEKYNLSYRIVEKIIHIQETILNESVSLLELNSSLRFVLETLIQSEILKSEPDYTFKLFYSIFNHQVDKGEKFIKRIKHEIEVMDKYEKKDNENLKIVTKGIANNEDPSKVKEKHKKAQEELDEESDLEYTIFCGNYKWYGYGLTKAMVKEQILPKYEERLIKFREMRIEKAKEIVKLKHISKYFNFRKQHSRVFKELKDNRSWDMKAKEVGLEKEYELVYDLTSALLHCTSYSLTTNNHSSAPEIEMTKTLIYKYSKKIMKNINEYAEMKFYSNFLVLDLINEEE